MISIASLETLQMKLTAFFFFWLLDFVFVWAMKNSHYNNIILIFQSLLVMPNSQVLSGSQIWEDAGLLGGEVALLF